MVPELSSQSTDTICTTTAIYTPVYPVGIEIKFGFDAGFNDIHLSEGFDGGELTRESTRLLVMGRT